MRARLFPFCWIVGVGLMVILLFPAAAQQTATPLSEMVIHDIPEAEVASLRETSDSFMRQFSGSTSFGEYEAAFETLLRQYYDDVEPKTSKAHNFAATSRAGLISLDSAIGPPVLGKFTFAGTRKVGSVFVEIAYWRHHRLGPTPLVITYTKSEGKWGISQINFGELAAPDIEACWVHEKPAQIAQRIPAFPDMAASIGECMDSILKGERRSAFETLVKKWSGDAPDPTRLSESLIRALDEAPDLGPVTGYVLIGTARQSDLLCRLMLTLESGKKHAPLSFEFYRAGESWILWKVRMFEDAAHDLAGQTVTTPAD